MLNRIGCSLALIASMALMAGAASATSVTETFPSAASSWSSATNGSGTGVPSNYMWTSGDYIAESFTGTGLGAVDQLTYSFSVKDDLGAENEVLDILINGVVVDSQTVMNCGYCETVGNYANTVDFAPISGAGDYALEIELTNTIAGGGGSILFPDVGSFTLTSSEPTPEPASLTLFGTALAGCGLIRRRKNA